MDEALSRFSVRGLPARVTAHELDIRFFVAAGQFGVVVGFFGEDTLAELDRVASALLRPPPQPKPGLPWDREGLGQPLPRRGGCNGILYSHPGLRYAHPQHLEGGATLSDPATTPPGRGITAHIERSLGALAVASFRRPGATLLIVALLSVGTGVGLRGLRLDTDLMNLLPKSFASVQALEALGERFGSVGYVAVVGMGAEPESLVRFAKDATKLIEPVEGIRYVGARRPVEFFEDHALYYADTADLQTALDRLKTRERWEKKRRNPMYLDLEDEQPPEVTFDDLLAKYRTKGDKRWLIEQMRDQWYIDRDRQMIVLLARPTEGTMDVDFAVDIVRRVETALAPLDIKSYGDKFSWHTTGRFKKKSDHKVQLSRDLRIASILALILMLGYLALHFRRLGAIVLIMGPLTVGLVWTLGLVGFIYGVLNILTGFIGAILLGIGIDHGIHLLARYDAERAAGAAPPDAVRAAFGETGRAVVVAALTTLAAFIGVALSEFRAFREFGVSAALGVVLVALAYWTLLPAMLAYAERRGSRKNAAPVRMSPFALRLNRWAKVTAPVGLALAALAMWQVKDVKFNWDFAALEDSEMPTFVLDKKVNRILGYHQNPIVALTKDEAQEREAADALRAKKAELSDRSTINMVASVADLVPTDQEAKRKILRAIGKTLKRVKPGGLTDEQREARTKALRMTAAEPFTRAGLPVEVRRQFTSVNGSGEEGFVMIFPSIDLTDGLAVEKLVEEVRGAMIGDGKWPIYAGESVILADILKLVRDEALPVLSVTLGLVALSLLIFLGSLSSAVLCFAAASISLLATLGLAAVAGLDINYINMVMIPVLFGLSVDGAVHLVGRHAGDGEHAAVFSEVGRSIAGAALTTILGFGVLNLADHPGLNSFGLLAVLGMSVSLVVNLVILPSVLTLRAHRRAAS